MLYQFTLDTVLQLQAAFSNISIHREKTRKNVFRSWDYIFLKFSDPVFLRNTDNPATDFVDIIFAGDDAVTKQYQRHFGETSKCEMGFRWIGSSSHEKIIQLLGFSMKISYPSHISSPVTREILIDLLVKSEFLKSKESDFPDFKQEPDTSEKLVRNHFPFFKKSTLFMPVIPSMQDHIVHHIPAIRPKYRRDSEIGINPAYQPLEVIKAPLDLNQKFIWILRSDGKFITGVKNAYWISFGENELAHAIPQNLHQYINWDDRSGHPSLAMEEYGYDGSALYGGYVCQRENHLQVFTSSGRYYRDDLSLEQKMILESYVAYHFQQQFGEQDIIFYEGPYKDYYELSLFFADKPFPPNVLERVYNTTMIQTMMTKEIPCIQEKHVLTR